MIPLLTVEEAIRRSKEAGIAERFAATNAFRMLLQNVPVARSSAVLWSMLMTQPGVPERTREMVILRTGWRTGSEYEFCRHVGRARQAGVSEQEVLGVRDPEQCRAYSETDRAVLRMTDELLDNSEISPATFAILQKTFSLPQIIEFIFIVGLWRTMATLFRSGKLPLDADIATGWPEGQRPPTA